MTVVRATGVSVAVKGYVLLDDVSLIADEGSWLSIIGPNGAGKSTLLRALAGGGVTAGKIEMFDRDLDGISQRQRAQLVSWVPQSPIIPTGMSVLDYVLLGRTPHLHPLANVSSSDVEIAQRILDDLDLSSLAARTVETLSGGERQRAIIGRALAQEAPILLLDEPTTALDLGHQQDVLRLLDRLRLSAKRTIISTMHDLTLAGQFADRLILLSGGTIAAEGSAVDVLTEQNITDHYRADVEVTRRGQSVLVVPRIDPQESRSTEETTHGH
jgi:iron complex transport system ATP-binding protein